MAANFDLLMAAKESGSNLNRLNNKSELTIGLILNRPKLQIAKLLAVFKAYRTPSSTNLLCTALNSCTAWAPNTNTIQTDESIQ